MPEIVKAELHDLNIIRNLAWSIWPTAYQEILSPAQLSYMLELIYSEQSLINVSKNLDQQFIIVYADEMAVGFAAYSPKNIDDHSVYRLHKLYVLPEQQGKGTGKFLLNFIIDEARRYGAGLIELNVNRQNKAIRFYTRMGFTISREEDIDIGAGYFMNDYVMSCEL